MRLKVNRKRCEHRKKWPFFARNIATKYLYRPVIGDAQEINFLQSFQLSQLGKKNVVNVFTIHCALPSQQKNSQLLLTNY